MDAQTSLKRYCMTLDLCACCISHICRAGRLQPGHITRSSSCRWSIPPLLFWLLAPSCWPFLADDSCASTSYGSNWFLFAYLTFSYYDNRQPRFATFWWPSWVVLAAYFLGVLMKLTPAKIGMDVTAVPIAAGSMADTNCLANRLHRLPAGPTSYSRPCLRRGIREISYCSGTKNRSWLHLFVNTI